MAYHWCMQIRSTNDKLRIKIPNSKNRSLNFRHSSFIIRYSSARCFTLIELMVVIAIIGILISIVSVGWASVARRGRDTTRKSDLAQIKQVLQQQYSDTRTYPIFELNFELNSAGVIYAASWQLTQSGSPQCSRQNESSSKKITPKYLDKIPIDPKDTLDYSSVTCASLTQNQGNRYLYITPTDANGPTVNPISFGLMATLERPGNDELTEESTRNPLGPNYNVPTFGSWYFTGRNNYGNTIRVNANYLIDSKNQ